MNSSSAQSAASDTLFPKPFARKWRWSLLIFLLCILGFSAWWGGSALYRALTFHPAGKIVFECKNLLCLVNADGSGYTQLTFQKKDRWPAWSPDGKRIAFLREEIGGEAGQTGMLYLINADGSGLMRLTDDVFIAGHPDWSPSGEQIAFTYLKREDNSAGIAVVNLQGQVVFLTNLSESQPTWSPDGKRIAFLENISTNSPNTTIAYLYIMNSDGSGKKPLAQINSFSPAWSPDGKKIAFRLFGIDKYGIWIVNADGSGMTQLTDSGVNPTWSPDGQYIAYSRDDPWCFLCSSTGQLMIMRADGLQQTKITDGPMDQNPAWQPAP